MRIRMKNPSIRKVVYVKENPEYLLSVKQVCERLGIPKTSINKVYKLLSSGYLKYIEFNGKKVSSIDLEGFISKLKTNPEFAYKTNQILKGKEVS